MQFGCLKISRVDSLRATESEDQRLSKKECLNTSVRAGNNATEPTENPTRMPPQHLLHVMLKMSKNGLKHWGATPHQRLLCVCLWESRRTGIYTTNNCCSNTIACDTENAEEQTQNLLRNASSTTAVRDVDIEEQRKTFAIKCHIYCYRVVNGAAGRIIFVNIDWTLILHGGMWKCSVESISFIARWERKIGPFQHQRNSKCYVNPFEDVSYMHPRYYLNWTPGDLVIN